MRDAAIAWIQSLCRGGIYDHLGGGIHRYTVDAGWLVPHFEKMLYDNALFIRALCTCFAATSDPLFKQRLEETVAFLLTGMRAPEGAFYSSFDADSEGEEGKFYVWSRNEIEATVGARAALFERVYGVTQAGNWEGENILNLLSGGTIPSVEEVPDARRMPAAAPGGSRNPHPTGLRRQSSHGLERSGDPRPCGSRQDARNVPTG